MSSQRVFSHILRTLIKRVISICAGLRGHFNQVEPVEVRIGRAGEVRLSSGEVGWLSAKRHHRTDSFTLAKCPQPAMEIGGRDQLLPAPWNWICLLEVDCPNQSSQRLI